jgi:hypothetical protein
MTLREWSALSSTLIGIIGTIWYIRLLLRGEKVRPVMATWIVLSCTTTLSLITYWTSPGHGLISGACVITGAITIWAVFFIILYVNVRNRTSCHFSSFQKFCLSTSAFIFLLWVVVVWGLGGTGIIPNIMTQVLMLIGYFVTAQKLWIAEENTESLFLWWSLIVAGLIALYTGLVSGDKLSVLYAARSVCGISVLVALMYRADRRGRRKLKTTVV